MKLIYMPSTVQLICKDPSEVKTKFLDKGFKVKETNNKIQYLIKINYERIDN